ncbi:MAG: hypothetical protein EXQ95_09740 [Alphaproteobacteria bacterium]|nr:hypothetical protein [Alphaproteobacteria bacterium]
MHGHTHGVSRERPDFARSGARCWIDGDLIRLSHWPIGGIRPAGRSGPIPWLMDLAVLEGAMQEVYGGHFRLGDRTPLLQMAANALASGDRRRAAALANEVSFPPPEYRSRFHDAGLRYLRWGPAHHRGNPPIDVEAWLDRVALERKFDPDQPRVSRGHPDGGQWTDDPNSGDHQENPGEELLTEEEEQKVGRLAEDARRLLADAGDPDALLVLAAGGDKPPKLPKSKSGALVFFAVSLETLMRSLAFEGRNSPVWHDLVDWVVAVNRVLPQFESFLDPPKEWEELVADPVYREFDSHDAFEEVYGSAGSFYDWHHLVEQKLGFSEQEVNNTENIVRAPRGRHWLITSFMTRGRFELGGRSWRQWLRGKSIEEHRRVGLEVLREAGVLK